MQKSPKKRLHSAKQTCIFNEPTNRSHPTCESQLSVHATDFATESYKRDVILRKRPVFLRSLLIVATAYSRLHLECHFFIHMGSHSYGITFVWDHIHMGSHSYDIVQPIAFGMSFLHSQITINILVFQVCLATLR